MSDNGPINDFDLADGYGSPQTIAFRTRVSGDSYDRLQILADGTIKRGPGSAAAGRLDFVPELYADEVEVASYGTTNYREGWYQDDGVWVRGVGQIRVGTNADVGADGAVFSVSLPVPADVNLGNNAAVLVGSVTLGIKVFTHKHANLHTQDAGGLRAYFVPSGEEDQGTPDPVGSLLVTNTLYAGMTSDGNATTGWHDFHYRFGYFKA